MQFILNLIASKLPINLNASIASAAWAGFCKIFEALPNAIGFGRLERPELRMGTLRGRYREVKGMLKREVVPLPNEQMNILAMIISHI